MENVKTTIQQLGIKVGLVICALYIGFFLLMKALNLGHISELRYINFLILILGLIYVFNYFKRPGYKIEYLSGMGLGFITSTVSLMPFAFFLYLYFSYIDPDLLIKIKSGSTLMSSYLTPLASAIGVAIEGIAYGVIVSFIIMQYYKSSLTKKILVSGSSKGVS
ncbi:MAG: hypothetical protein ACKVQV_14335 [Bacteroidia bacterium]